MHKTSDQHECETAEPRPTSVESTLMIGLRLQLPLLLFWGQMLKAVIHSAEWAMIPKIYVIFTLEYL